MARVKLHRREVQRGLPRVCMCCGEEAATERSRKFSWYPPWVNVFILLGLLGVLLVIILASIMTKKMTVRAPLCMRHQNHWQSRKLLILGGFLGLAAVGVLAVLIGILLESGRGHRSDGSVIAFVIVGVSVFFVVFLIVACVIQAGAIKPSEITDNSITLVKVHQGFIDALDQLDQDEWESRPRRRPPPEGETDEYFDPDERQRRPWLRDGFRDEGR